MGRFEELIAFAPAFEAIFPFGCELPGRESAEDPLLEALGYCCQLGLRGQAPVWLAPRHSNRSLRCILLRTRTVGCGASSGRASSRQLIGWSISSFNI